MRSHGPSTARELLDEEYPPPLRLSPHDSNSYTVGRIGAVARLSSAVVYASRRRCVGLFPADRGGSSV
jgi:hypothetical protein